MIEQRFTPHLIDSSGNKKQKLEVLFDMEEFYGKRLEIFKRMNYNKPDRIQRYLIKVEGLELSSRKTIESEGSFFTHEISPGNHYYDSDRELFLTKGVIHPILKIVIYGDETLNRDRLLDINRLNNYLITGKTE